MRVVSTEVGNATVEFSRHELVVVNNALNEILESVWHTEFTTRIGAEQAEVSALLDEVHAVLEVLPVDADSVD